jgi:hypothetical protein
VEGAVDRGGGEGEVEWCVLGGGGDGVGAVEESGRRRGRGVGGEGDEAAEGTVKVRQDQ